MEYEKARWEYEKNVDFKSESLHLNVNGTYCGSIQFYRDVSGDVVTDFTNFVFNKNRIKKPDDVFEAIRSGKGIKKKDMEKFLKTKEFIDSGLIHVIETDNVYIF